MSLSFTYDVIMKYQVKIGSGFGRLSADYPMVANIVSDLRGTFWYHTDYLI